MKIALIGYGRMGHEIERQAIQRGHEIVARIDIDNRADLHSDAFRSADVAIEFTAPTAAFDNCLEALEEKVPVVSGSTGWLERLPELAEYCRLHPGSAMLQSTNFSIGMNIFMRLNRELARLTRPFTGYTPRLEETHHIHKLDHPSGTAITLAEGLISERPDLKSWTLTDLTEPSGGGESQSESRKESQAESRKESQSESRKTKHLADAGADSLPIASIRRGEVPGIHTIEWDSEADSITITHSAHSRSGFALGAVMAAEWLPANPGFRTMAEFMDFLFKN